MGGVEYKLYCLSNYPVHQILFSKQIDAEINEIRFKLYITYIKLERCYKYSIEYRFVILTN